MTSLFQGFRLPHVILAAYLYAGAFKTDERIAWIPMDVTLLLALLAGGAAFWTLAASGLVTNRPIWWFLMLQILCIIPLAWTDWTPYAIEKTTRMFTLTAGASAVAFVLVQNLADLRSLLNALALVGLTLCIDGAILLQTGTVTGQLGEGTSDPTCLGRLAGVSALWLSVLGVESTGWVARFRYLLPALLAFAIMLGAGARGPILFAAVCFTLLGIIFYLRDPAHRYPYLACIAGTLTLFSAALAIAPERSISRIETVMRGELDLDSTYRPQLFADAWAVICSVPEGLGWAGYEEVSHSPGGYPHNIILESLVEGGWLLGGYMTALFAWGLYRANRLLQASGPPENRGLFTVLLFILLGSLVAGDWNDNRDLFVVLTVALTLPIPASRTKGGPVSLVAAGPARPRLACMTR